MPEGHSVHRIALQMQRTFVGRRVATSSPQGRFAAGAAELDGREIVASSAVGKHLLLEFEGERTLHVHLGIYGKWGFAGEVPKAPAFTVIDGNVTTPELLAEELPAERNPTGDAPRQRRVEMSESDREMGGEEEEEALEDGFPAAPVGQVRLRLLSETAVADLRGPTACEVFNPDEVDTLLARIGPDPMHDASRKAENRFVQRVMKTSTPIGLLLMDQSVVAGIGNIYRAELLFRARLNPHAPGKTIPEAALRRLWKDWAQLLAIGVATGSIITRKDLKTDADYRRALRNSRERNYVYKREGLKSLHGKGNVVMEDMGGRNLFWAPGWQTKPEG